VETSKNQHFENGGIEMQRNRLSNLMMTLGLLLILGAGTISLVGRASAQETVVQGVHNPQAAVGDAFTYQGYLEKDGSPVTGTCDYIVILYATENDANVLATDDGTFQAKDGYFSIPLDFGVNAFNGETRWMAVYVRCPSGEGSHQGLDGRIPITAAPYAHSLKPGATVSGDVYGSVLEVTNLSSTGISLRGVTQNPSNKWPPSGAGVWGDSYLRPGVVGTSNDAAGVYGWSTTDYGVMGLSDSGHGLFGTSTTGYAVYANGDAHVEGDLTWQAKTSYVSVSAAAFQPYNNILSYSNSGSEVSAGNTVPTTFYAPVQLPHGATVTKVTFYWYDSIDDDEAYCDLRRNALDGTDEWVASMVSKDAAGAGSTETETINNPVVDNANYAYYLYLYLPYVDIDNQTKGYGVIIEYTFIEPY
jgi:hypothetical protein